MPLEVLTAYPVVLNSTVAVNKMTSCYFMTCESNQFVENLMDLYWVENAVESGARNPKISIMC